MLTRAGFVDAGCLYMGLVLARFIFMMHTIVVSKIIIKRASCSGLILAGFSQADFKLVHFGNISLKKANILSPDRVIVIIKFANSRERTK